MTEQQRKLLMQLGNLYIELANQCNDDSFNELMIKNNDLFPMSLEELGLEWYAVARNERKKELQQNTSLEEINLAYKMTLNRIIWNVEATNPQAMIMKGWAKEVLDRYKNSNYR